MIQSQLYSNIEQFINCIRSNDSNKRKLRGYIQTHRFDASYSERYAALEDVFVKIGKKEEQGGMSETIYRMDTLQKNLLETFLVGRNQA